MSEDHTPHWSSSVIRYVAWFLAIALMFITAYQIREAALDVFTYFGVRQVEELKASGDPLVDLNEPGRRAQAYDTGVIILLCVVMAGAAVASEYYLRKNHERGHLIRGIVTVFGVLAALLAVSVLVQALV